MGHGSSRGPVSAENILLKPAGGNAAEARAHCVELCVGQPHATTSKTNTHSFFPEQTETQSRSKRPKEETPTSQNTNIEIGASRRQRHHKHPRIETPMYSVLSTLPVCLKQSNNAPPAKFQEPKDPVKANGGNDLSVRLISKLISTAIDTRQPSKRSRVTPRRQSGGELSPVTDVI